MRLPLLLTAALALAPLAHGASAEMIEKMSPHSVAMTLDRLQNAVEGAGATVFARVDHAAGAQKIAAKLRPTQMLMFGNPALGTPAMQDAQSAGLDLPLRVLAYEDASGQVRLVYHAPATLAQTHGLPAEAEYLAKMTGALNALTDRAVAAE